MKCKIINGPNLNLLGKREPHIYGDVSFEDHLESLRKSFPEMGIEYFQSNVEGEIINQLQEVNGKYDGIILNAGAYTHTSIAIADALSSMQSTVIEVHISNIMNREAFREKSLISSKCKGTITGFGLKSYDLALYYIQQIAS